MVIEGDVDQNSGINEEKIIGLLNERKGPVVIVFNGDFSFSELKAEVINCYLQTIQCLAI